VFKIALAYAIGTAVSSRHTTFSPHMRMTGDAFSLAPGDALSSCTDIARGRGAIGADNILVGNRHDIAVTALFLSLVNDLLASLSEP
jgi:hypothetical protein